MEISELAVESRLRIQEATTVYKPVAADVSEGRVRKAEIITAVDREARSSAATAVSEARQRLQEGTKISSHSIKMASRPSAPVLSAASVPSGDASQIIGAAANEISSSLRRIASDLQASSKNILSNPSVTTLLTENPFEHGDDYDETKNPFAQPEDTKKEDSTNPFCDDDEDDYNESLNPFAE